MERTRWWLPLWSLVIYFFLYVPIVVLILFSFNKAGTPFAWQGFTLEWYRMLWQSSEMLTALKNSLLVASSAVALSLVLAMFFVYYSARTSLSKTIIFFYTGLATPEIVVAVSLLSLFAFAHVPLGLTTLIAGHTLLGLGYAIPLLQSRFNVLEYSYTQAALDLGATQGQVLRKIILPLMMPALLSAALLVFVVSLDDFIISFFCAGASTQTLPIYIFAMIRSNATPVINALSTLLLMVSSAAVLVFSSLRIKKTDVMR